MNTNENDLDDTRLSDTSWAERLLRAQPDLPEAPIIKRLLGEIRFTIRGGHPLSESYETARRSASTALATYRENRIMPIVISLGGKLYDRRPPVSREMSRTWIEGEETAVECGAEIRRLETRLIEIAGEPVVVWTRQEGQIFATPIHGATLTTEEGEASQIEWYPTTEAALAALHLLHKKHRGEMTSSGWRVNCGDRAFQVSRLWNREIE